MNKVFKKITAYTLVGAIVAGSFGGYRQVNAKEADTGRKTKLEKFKTFCMEAPNGSPYDSSDVKAFSKVSYAD